MDKFSRQAVFGLLSYALVGLAWLIAPKVDGPVTGYVLKFIIAFFANFGSVNILMALWGLQSYEELALVLMGETPPPQESLEPKPIIISETQVIEYNPNSYVPIHKRFRLVTRPTCNYCGQVNSKEALECRVCHAPLT